MEKTKKRAGNIEVSRKIDGGKEYMMKEEEEPILKKRRVEKEAEGNPRAKRKKRQIFAYGNYDRYYGYRIKHSTNFVRKDLKAEWSADSRLELFRSGMFREKKCLDIGCNAGYFTMSVAQRFEPVSILGLDIDHSLILKAKKILKIEKFRNRRPTDDGMEIAPSKSSVAVGVGEGCSRSECDDKKKEDLAVTTNDAASTSLSTRQSPFPFNVQFRCLNFVATDSCMHGEEGTYDTVLCLSVSKWIHLNWGDEGIRRLFRKVYQLLVPGGRFLLEPQPWKSYRKKYKITERTKKNFYAIAMRPTEFKTFLTETVGFRRVSLLGKPEGCVRGFRRAIYEYIK
eukprot:g199.t1